MDVVIVGAGHAGLAASQRLTRSGVDHVVLERGRVGESWRRQRWDAFTLNTPSWMNRMPGDGEGGHAEPPDGFLTHHQFVERLDRYVADWDLPVQEGVNVASVEPIKAGAAFRVHLGGGADATIECRSVVVASGVQNVPRLPPIATSMPRSMAQLAALDYKRARQLPAGGVLVVGGGQTGGQIVEDLLGAGREVYWSVSAVPRIPRRYRGRDIHEWLADAGYYEAPAESITDPALLRATMPIISGVGRYGHTLSLQWLAAKGAQLIGRITSIEGSVLRLDDSVEYCIRFADRRSREICAQIDDGIRAAYMELPPLEPDEADEPFTDFASLHPPERLDLRRAGLTSVIWATGVTGDLGHLPQSATTRTGEPEHRNGASAVDGIEYVGLPWLTRRSSGLIHGIGTDSDVVSKRVTRRLTP